MQLGHADKLLQRDVHTKMLCYNMPLLANRVIEQMKSVQLEQWRVLTATPHVFQVLHSNLALVLMQRSKAHLWLEHSRCPPPSVILIL